MSVPASDPATAAQRATLAELAAELRRRGFHARLVTRPGSRPRLAVRNPRAEIMTELIYAEGDWFLWSWQQPVAPRGQIAAAADRITRVLRTLAPAAAGD